MRRIGNRDRVAPFVALVSNAILILAISAAAEIERPDTWVAAKVKTALLTDGKIAGTEVHVSSRDGYVTLYGRAASTAEKQMAEERALRIEGVRSVRNLTRVIEPGRAIAAELTDAEIGKNVASAIAGEPELADSDIRIESVVDGLVLLSGTAATAEDHRKAIETARSQPNVDAVATLVRSPDRRTDFDLWSETGEADPNVAQDLYITTMAKLRLVANESTPALEIGVETDRGVVTVLGVVRSDAAREAAEMEIRQVRWVRRVENQLKVIPPTDPRPEATATHGDKATFTADPNPT